MNDSSWTAFLDRIKREYNAPPAPPREEMWAKIEKSLTPKGDATGSAAPAEATAKVARGSWSFGHRGSWTVMASIAALLLLWLGFGIGRASAPGPSLGEVASVPDDATMPEFIPGPEFISGQVSAGTVVSSTPGSAYGFAAARLLASTGTLLTQVNEQASSGILQADAGTWARGLLTQTRLMLDLPAVADNGLRVLLEDLELLLMQVVTVSGAQEAGDAEVGGFELEQLTNGLREGDVLPRIRRMLPPVLASDS